MLTVLYLVVFILVHLNKIQAGMYGQIVGGEQTTVSKYPHSAFLDAQCRNKQWICGASVLNQRMILTAAHCVVDCPWKREKNSKLIVYVGHTDLQKVTVKRQAVDVKVHEKYDDEHLDNDIAIGVLLKNLPLGKAIKRVALPITFPKNVNTAYIAGWGLTHVKKPHSSTTLKHVSQIIRSKEVCNMIGNLNRGMFCAGSTEKNSDHAAKGDSGSALIFKTYIQIGIVSFNTLRYPSLGVYTNISYYYNWINKNSRKLYCDNKT